ncbi:ABC transporter permease [Desulfosporosinus sp. BICA1-9]|uniref:ABC transporter permease n=1 Tax=Desulfosporosinus sp. BICA1-9 TaxID=1531958 RepID=UPI000AAA56BB|nr:ABC transporter permease [Desulfosporosinus sp. BICA1-9]
MKNNVANPKINLKDMLSKSISGSGGGIIIAFCLLIVILSIASPHFMTVSNITIIIRQAVFVAIIGFGMTFVIGMGGIDLSVGATMSICGLVAADLILKGQNIFFAILVALIIGTFIGFINGLLISKVGIADFITTLAIMSILRGIIMVYSKGMPIYGLRFPELQYLAQGFIGPVPVPVLLTVISMILCYYLMYRTKFGRYTLSIGSNSEAARLVGINITKIKILVYSLTGLLAAIAGVLLTSRLEAAMPEAGMGYELDVIAATVIGGTSLSGGKASLIGTAVGAVLMAVVRNGLNLLNINVFWHQVVIGSIILIAVGIDRFSSINLKNGLN